MKPTVQHRPAVLLGLLFLCLGTAASMARAGDRPDLMVSVESTGHGDDDVVLGYTIPVTPDQIKQDIASICATTGWHIDKVQVSIPDTVSWDAGGTCSAQFMTPAAIDRASGRLPVQQLVMALRDHPRIALVFDVAGDFNYLGRTSYDDPNVSLRMQERVPDGYTYAFDVQIKNATFSGMDKSVGLGPESIQKHGVTLLSVLMALGLALLVGWGVYQMMLRLVIRVEGPGS